MSHKTQEPSEGMSLEGKSSRRTLLKRALVVLGAGAILQVSGGVLYASEEPKKDFKQQSKKDFKQQSKTVKGSERPSFSVAGEFKQDATKGSTFKQDTVKGSSFKQDTVKRNTSKSHKTTKGLETPKKEGS